MALVSGADELDPSGGRGRAAGRRQGRRACPGSPATTRSSRSPARRAAASPRSSTPSSGPTSRRSAHAGRRRRGRPRLSGVTPTRPSCSTGSASPPATSSTPGRRSAGGRGRRRRPRRHGSWDRSTGWCCSTCPTSTRASSRTAGEAERVLELVDVFVWVTDPQKYADARLHDEFVSLLSQHDAVTLAVLNQSDRLTRRGGEGRHRRPREAARRRRRGRRDGAARRRP